MIGLGTIINVAAVMIGGFLGRFCGRFLNESCQDSLIKVSGVSVLFIAIAGTLEGMLTVTPEGLTSGGSMLIVACLTLGTLIGEFLNIEDKFEAFGEWLKRKTGNSGEASFVDAFVTTSLTICIGAMAIVGSIQDGIFGDYSILATKAVLDLIIILVMTCSMGKGCAFSAIPVGILQGSITLLARLIQPLMTDAALANLSLVGNIMIFCVGVNLVWGKKIRVANMLPGLIIAVAIAFLPFSL